MSVIGVLILGSDPKEYFETTVGEITFSGDALLLASATNLCVFGLRNLYQLLKEPECLVVLSCLVEFGEGDGGIGEVTVPV